MQRFQRSVGACRHHKTNCFNVHYAPGHLQIGAVDGFSCEMMIVLLNA